MQFENIFDTYKKLVYNLALHYVQNIEDAEEITQDVFVSVYEGFSTFKNDSTVKTWIYRITVNKSLDYIKSKKRKKRFGFMTGLFSETTTEPRPEISDFNHPGVILEQTEAVKKIFDGINQLNENQKTALILSKIDDRSQKEIAEIMELSTSAVESLLGRAKKNLSEILK